MAKLKEDIFLISPLRTPIGKFGGALSALTAVQLGTTTASATIGMGIAMLLERV
jgi:acetyl-CoA acetyltransferase